MTDAIRAFLAVDLPAAVRDRLVGLVDVAREQLPPARWVAAGNLHLTVKFLGEVEPLRLAAVTAGIVSAVTGSGPACVRLHGGGFFPDRRRPRIAWIGGDAPTLQPIVATVERTAAAHGFDRDRRGWTPHLTLARLRRPWSGAAIDRYLELAAETDVPPFDCRELVLFESRLEPSGAVYTPRERIPLG